MKRAILIAVIILALVTGFSACAPWGDADEATAPSATDVTEIKDSVGDAQPAAETVATTTTAAARANSWQPNVTDREVPKPQSGALTPVFDIGCRVLGGAAHASGLVLFDCGNKHSIIAMEIATGQEKWRFTTEESVNSPFEMDGIVYATGENNVFAIDVASGSELWRVDRNMDPNSRSRFIVRTVAVDGGTLFVLGESDGMLHAYDARTGEPKWDYAYGTAAAEAEAMQTRTNDEEFDVTVPSTASPVVAGDLVYITSTHIDGINKRSAEQLRAVDVKSGEERWAQEREGVMFGKPVIADGILFAGDIGSGFSMSVDVRPETRPESSMYAFDAATGEEIWNFRVDQESLGGFAAARGKVFVSAVHDEPSENGRTRKAGRIYALDAATGEVAWSFDTEGALDAGVFVAGGMVLFGSQENPVGDGAITHTYARDAATGEHRWMLWNEDPKQTLPPLQLIVEGKAYFMGTGDERSFLSNVE